MERLEAVARDVAGDGTELASPADKSGVEKKRPKSPPVFRTSPVLTRSPLRFSARQRMLGQDPLRDMSGEDAEEILKSLASPPADEKVKMVATNRETIDLHAKTPFAGPRDLLDQLAMPEQSPRPGCQV